MEFPAGFVLDGVGAGLEALDILAQVSVFLLNVGDLLLEFAVLSALLMPDGEAVIAVNDMPHHQGCQEHSDDCAGGTPCARCPGEGLFAPGERRLGGCGAFGLETFRFAWVMIG